MYGVFKSKNVVKMLKKLVSQIINIKSNIKGQSMLIVLLS